MYNTPAPEFAVSVLCIDGEHLGHEIDAPTRHDGPQILLCTEGSTVVHAKASAVTLERGAAAWVAADDGPIRLARREPDEAVPRHRGDLVVFLAAAERQHVHDRDDHGADDQSDHRRHRGVEEPGQ